MPREENIHHRLKNDERQRCEIWPRVMGYHRPVSSFSIGKKGEYQERTFYCEEKANEDRRVYSLQRIRDYPDHLSAVLFCQGCTWRCGYCHNHSLQPFAKSPEGMHWERIFSFLEKRKDLLDGVVFSVG